MKTNYALILLTTLSLFLAGCGNNSDRQPINPEKAKTYVYDKKTNEVYFAYADYWLGLPIPKTGYKKVPSSRPKQFKVFNSHYGTDGLLVFYQNRIIKNANSAGFALLADFPEDFAKDSIGKTYYNKNCPLTLDFASAKIHSLYCVSDQNGVFLKEYYRGTCGGFSLKIPVQDIESFKIIKDKTKSGKSLVARDKHWWYIETVRLPVPSQNTKMLNSTLLPVFIFLHKDKLHYVSTHIPPNMFSKLPSHFQLEEKGVFAKIEETYDSYYHFIISGLQNVKYIPNSSWFTDDNGLYFMEGTDIFQVSEKRQDEYSFDPKHPNFLKTKESLFFTSSKRSAVFSSSATIINDRYKLVIDKGQLYQEGELIPNVHTPSFTKTKNAYFVDQNFFYYDVGFQGSMKNRRAIPPWAYEGLKNGTLPKHELWIDKKAYGRTYWNGFLLTMMQSSKKPDLVELEFKNIERKTLSLSQPIEEQLYVFYGNKKMKLSDFRLDTNLQLTPRKEYNYAKIKVNQTIRFAFLVNPEKAGQILVISNQQKYDKEALNRLFLRMELKK